MIFATILLRSLAAVFAKKAALFSSDKGFESILFNPWTGAELIALAAQAILWSHVLNRYPLSKAYPFMSLVLIVNVAAAWFLFNEVIKPHHLVGILLIVCGILIVNSSSAKYFPLQD